YIEEEESANKKNNATTDEDDEEDKDDTEYLAARSKITSEEEEESDEYEENSDVKTDADIVKYFADKYEIELDSSNIENAYFFNFVNTIIRNKVADKEAYDNMRSALKSVKNDLGEILDYDYFLTQEICGYIVEKYTDHVGTISEVVDNVDSNVTVRYNKQVEADLKSYVEQEDFSSAVSAGTFTYAAPSKSYIQVKSILLSFSEAQSAALKHLTSMYPNNEDMVKSFRAAIATGFADGSIDEDMLKLYTKLGIKVNVSNPDYDADEDELKDAYTDATIEDVDNAYANPSVDFLTILYAMATDIQGKVDLAMQAAKDMSELEQYLVKEYASKQAFNDWINLVNDDSGMFSNDFYAVTPHGEATTYVPEYTVLARALTDEGVGATAISDYSAGETISDEVAYGGDTAILKAANGKYTIYKTQASSSVGEDEDAIETDIFTLVTEDGAKISFIVNDYGIHIVMVTGLPVDENKGSFTTQTATDSEDNEVEMYIKGIDYVYDYSVKITYATDEDGNEDKTAIEAIEVEVTTIKENYQETVKSELSLDITSLNQYNLFADSDFAEKSEKVFKQIMNSIQ
ncbi:MAG: hypothetical protein K2G37_01800, partial [Clostridia bacterium]|nr:hypothetical protein [Clostridia bacterium]